MRAFLVLRIATSIIMNTTPQKKRILILCTANSCRSQMAEGLINHLFGQYFVAVSAGTHPNVVLPEVIAVLKEIEINISHHHSKSISAFYGDTFDFVITVCADVNRNCPTFIGSATKLHWEFDDPSRAPVPKYGDILDPYRDLRDTMRAKFTTDIPSLGEA